MMVAEGTASSAASRLVLKEAAAPSHNKLTCRGAGAAAKSQKGGQGEPSLSVGHSMCLRTWEESSGADWPITPSPLPPSYSLPAPGW